MRLVDVCSGKNLEMLTGIVGHVWNMRETHRGISPDNSLAEDGSNAFTNNGPLAKNAKRVFSLSLCGHGSRAADGKEIMLFFYDTWGEKCSFLQPGDILTVSGPSQMVFPQKIEAKDDLPYCLVFHQDMLSSSSYKEHCGVIKVTVESKNADSNWEKVEITSLDISATFQRSSLEKGSAVKANKVSKRPLSSTKENIKLNPLPSLAYVYSALDTLSVHEKMDVNIFAVICSYQQPKLCRGTHKFTCSYSLIDPSIDGIFNSASLTTQATSQPIVLVLFANELSHFPPVKQVGDILRLHRVKVSEFNNMPQLVASVHKSSFVHFHRKPALSDDVDKTQSYTLMDRIHWHWELTPSSTNFSICEKNLETVEMLYRFILKCFPLLPSVWQCSAPGESAKEPQPFAIDIKALRSFSEEGMTGPGSEKATSTDMSNVDIVVLLISIRGSDDVNIEGLPSSLHLLVWDGSDEDGGSIVPNGNKTITKSDMAVDQGALGRAIHSLQFVLSKCNINFEGPELCGGFSVLSLERSHAWHQMKAACCLVPGTWLRLKKIHVSSRSVILGGDSAVNVLPPYHSDVTRLAINFATSTLPLIQRRNLANVAPSQKRRRMVASTGHPLSPLALCLSVPSPAEFYALVRIRSFYPPEFSSFVTLHDPEREFEGDTQVDTLSDPFCDVNGQSHSAHLKYTYMFSVCIYDDTACCDAIVFGEDGDKLFGGVTAKEFHNSAEIRATLQDKLNDAIQGMALFEFQLVTYMTSNISWTSSEIVHDASLINTPSIDSCNRIEEEDPDRKIIKRVRIVNSSFFQKND